MKKLLLGAVIAILISIVIILSGHTPTTLECFLYGIIASLLAEVLIDDKP